MRIAALRTPILAVVLCLASARPALAQADTIPARPLFTDADLLLTAGIIVSARLIHPLDEQYMERLQDSSTQANRRLQVLSTMFRTTAAPGAYLIGTSMYAAGRIGGNAKLADLGLHGTEALIVGEIAATTLKIIVGRARPFTGEGPKSYGLGRGLREGRYKSFPSGHSVTGFAAAAAVSSETSRWWPDTRWILGPALYGGAALVGASRMYNNQHWASDVIVGAGIGTLAGLKVVRYHHANPGNRVDRWLLAGSVIPTGDGGHTVRWTLLPSLGPR